ncbi:hypothetical protein HDK90DRAFT_7100 [Phyllosticta capitalensis]|uniref:Secreted protein n=1 Tax=Phyllosticta capitalensis TaxID=121624 RepID=A0ABR1Z1J9_9PEZI
MTHQLTMSFLVLRLVPYLGILVPVQVASGFGFGPGARSQWPSIRALNPLELFKPSHALPILMGSHQLLSPGCQMPPNYCNILRQRRKCRAYESFPTQPLRLLFAVSSYTYNTFRARFTD